MADDADKRHSKDAKLLLKLRADSGYKAEVETRVSADQWERINAIIFEEEK